jgi:hypothetical protein
MYKPGLSDLLKATIFKAVHILSGDGVLVVIRDAAEALVPYVTGVCSDRVGCNIADLTPTTYRLDISNDYVWPNLAWPCRTGRGPKHHQQHRNYHPPSWVSLRIRINLRSSPAIRQTIYKYPFTVEEMGVIEGYAFA